MFSYFYLQSLRDEGKPDMELLDEDGLENTKSLVTYFQNLSL